jgi:pectinesterase
MATGGTGGTGGSAGSDAGVDPCLPPCEDPAGCMITPEQQLMIDFCRIYQKRCPDQPTDVMRDSGSGEAIAAGLAAPSTATRPKLSEATADALHSIEEAFRGGGVYTVAYTGSGMPGTGGESGGTGAAGESGATGVAGQGGSFGGEPLGTRTVSYAEGAWEPRGPIEDETKIVPGLVVDPNGDPMTDGTYKTIQSAISAAVVVAGCPRVFIKVLPGTYREKITVPAKTSSPPVTLYGVDRDASRVRIVAGHSAAGSDDEEMTPLTIHQSATFTNSLPQPFHARNLTIANDYVAGTRPGDPDVQTAVALLSQADQALFDNVRILGHRNALYVKSTGANEVSRVYFRNCYIEGDEDIILGRGAAVIDQSRIHSLGDRVAGGAISAASTRVDNPHGVLIINSELTADARVTDVALGHHWYEGEEVVFLKGYLAWLNIEKQDILQSRNLDSVRESWRRIANAFDGGHKCIFIAYIPTKAEVYMQYVLPEHREAILQGVEQRTAVQGDWIWTSENHTPTFSEWMERKDNLRNILREITLEEGYSFVDLTVPFSEVAWRGEELFYLYDTHMNQHGHNLVGEIVQQVIREAGCIAT